MSESKKSSSFKAKVDWVGDSIRLRLPSDAAVALGLRRGDIELEIEVEGEISRVRRVDQSTQELCRVMDGLEPEELAVLQAASRRYSMGSGGWGEEFAEINDPHSGGRRRVRVMHEIKVRSSEKNGEDC